jgi:hypothetical protein
MFAKKNKKASMLDLIWIGVTLLAFGMVLLIGFKVSDSFNTQIQGMEAVDAYGKTSTAELNAHYSTTMDNSFLFLTIGLAMVTLILAALVRVHPVFIPLFLIGLVLIIFFTGIFSNIYQEMAANTALTALADQMTFTSYILEYLPLVIGIIGVLLMVVMYKLWSVSQLQ